MNDSVSSCRGTGRYPELGQYLPVHRRTALHRTVGALLLLLGCGLLGTALWLVPALSGAVSQTHAFRRAEPCPAGREDSGAGCLKQLPAMIAGVHIHQGKHDSSYVDVTGETLRNLRVFYREGDDKTARHWRQGDRATVTVWRREIVAVAVNGRRVQAGAVWNEDRFLGMTVLLCLAMGGACTLYGFFRLRPAPGPACEPDPRADALHPVWITAVCWIVPTAVVTDILDLPIEAAVAFWLAGLLFTVRAAGRAVYRARTGARPEQDPASISPRLDRLFGPEGLLLPARRQEFCKESEALEQGRRIHFPGLLPQQDTGLTMNMGVLALENGSLYTASSHHAGVPARQVPLDGYRLSGIRLLHLTPIDRMGNRAHPRNWQAAELEGKSKRLTIVTDPVHLRRILQLLDASPRNPATDTRQETAAEPSRR
ncbi:hypothetical protein [Streptomyces sp. NPDC008001]|uniref:hypothetical protein n=1 Tax=Streptomyces sp. NPDC008001 TaxID=3364804 RepID=UPI0036F145D0